MIYPELFLQEALVHLNKRWLITRHPTMPVMRSRLHKVIYIQFSVSYRWVFCCYDCLLYFYFPSLGSQEVVFASSDIRLRPTDLKVKKTDALGAGDGGVVASVDTSEDITKIQQKQFANEAVTFANYRLDSEHLPDNGGLIAGGQAEDKMICCWIL